jgi:hypothetical protein
MRTSTVQQFIRLRRELTAERETIQTRLREINEALGEMPAGSTAPSQPSTGAEITRGRGGRRTMSAEGRARIAAAQRARWAKQKGETGGQVTAVGENKPKRRMSAAARKAIAEAAKRRWAAAKAAGKRRL